MKRQIFILISILLLTTVAFAHGNEQHVMGTVTEVSGKSITVETTDKQKVTVFIAAETKLVRGTSSATLTDLKVGDRVVIHAVKAQNGLQAHTVQIGVSQAMAHHQHKTK